MDFVRADDSVETFIEFHRRAANAPLRTANGHVGSLILSPRDNMLRTFEKAALKNKWTSIVAASASGVIAFAITYSVVNYYNAAQFPPENRIEKWLQFVPQFFPLITGIVAVMAYRLAKHNLNTIKTKNSRDATFAMLTRWTSTVTEEYKKKVLQTLKDARMSFHHKDYNAELDKLLSDAIQPAIASILAETKDEIQKPHNAEHFSQGHLKILDKIAACPVTSNYEASLCAVVKTLSEYHIWQNTLDSDYRATLELMKSKLVSAFNSVNQNELSEYIRFSKNSKFPFTDAYTMRLSPSSEFTTSFIQVAQVISEIYALYRDEVIDLELTKSLFSYSFTEWVEVMDRVECDESDTRLREWLETQVFPFPLLITGIEYIRYRDCRL